MRYRKKPVVVNAEQFRASTYMQSDFLKAVVQDKAHLGEMWFGTTAADGNINVAIISYGTVRKRVNVTR